MVLHKEQRDEKGPIIEKVPKVSSKDSQSLSTTSSLDPNEMLARDIFRQLTQFPGLDTRHIEVQVNNGSVTLGGSIGANQAKAKVEDIILGIAGVKKVDNQIEVINTLAHPYADPWI